MADDKGNALTNATYTVTSVTKKSAFEVAKNLEEKAVEEIQ